MRTHDYLYIRNFRPDRWPAGHPAGFKGARFGYYDIDGCPSKTFLIDNAQSKSIAKFFHLAVDKRPAEELYDIHRDPGNLENLALNPKYGEVKKKLARQCEDYLRQTGDPRVTDGGDIYDSYKRFSRIREFPPPVSQK